MRIYSKPFNGLPLIPWRVDTSSWIVDYRPNSLVFKGNDEAIVVVEGEVYYCVGKTGKPDNSMLKHVYDSVGESNFSKHVEGAYNVVVAKGNSITVFGDSFNRINLFYGKDVISTEYRDVLSCFNAIEYEPMVLYCLMVLGYPPSKHTPYRGLSRLSIGERLLLTDDIHLVKDEINPILSSEMGNAELGRYADILENAILSRSNPSNNWVELSGGWDSTIILGVLRQYFDTTNVHATTVAVKLRDGRLFNQSEIEKSIKICKYYNVPLEVATFDLSDVRLIKTWNKFVRDYHYPFVCEHPFLFQSEADFLSGMGKLDATVFMGSFSDSLHNFGFSQYISLPYLSHEFRQYGDKIKSYLYSPSFLKKVFDNTFENDFAYKMFQHHYPKVKFVDTSLMTRNERVFRYLLSFVLSKERVPFAPIATDLIFLNDAKVLFTEWLYNNYFKDAVEQIDCDNMYFWLTWLYQNFHLQGVEKGLTDASFHNFEKRVRQPFYDIQLVKFLQTMPEDWGRGLEWRPTKYPLRHYGCEKLKIPYEIIESIPHSYLNEIESGRSINLHSEILNNSILTSGVWGDIRSKNHSGRYFDKEWFDISVLDNMLKTGNGESESILLFRQLMLLSLGI